jgi:SWI/SNF-related matrix-associated actin-dependent regulator 1 of chromatin subfamily A
VEVEIPDGKQLYSYQGAGILHLLENSRSLLCDEMGLGKGVQAVVAINAAEVRRVLVVCPASVRFIWERELMVWLTRPATVTHCVNGFKQATPKVLQLEGEGAPLEIFICSYAMLKLLEGESFDWVIGDEAHYVKNYRTTRTKQLRGLAARSPRLTLMTGTPIANRPVDLFSLLSMINSRQWPRFFPFAQRYCAAVKNRWGWDFSGAANLEELHGLIRRHAAYLRRTKRQVLPDLPPKRISYVPLDIMASELLQKLQEAIAARHGLSWQEMSAGTSPEYWEKMLLSKVSFDLISTVRMELGRIKAIPAGDYLIDLLEGGGEDEKLVIFAHHREVIDYLADRLKEYGIAILRGDTSAADRIEAVDSFQTNSKVRVFIGALAAAGAGITLTASSRVILVEQSWNPGDNHQAIDRLHRISQTEPVLADLLYVPNSLDSKVMGLCGWKADKIAKVI